MSFLSKTASRKGRDLFIFVESVVSCPLSVEQQRTTDNGQRTTRRSHGPRVTLLAFVLLLAGHLWAAERQTFIYYYGWYGNPDVDGEWRHWTENGHRPPLDLASSFYPRLGAYSSNDLSVIDLHMRWISESGIDVLIYSWWGRTDPSNFTAPAVLNSAADYGLKVTFLIEPYETRTINSIANDIQYVYRWFGNHPAFFKLSRNTSSSRNASPRGMFFLFAPNYSDQELRRLSDTVHLSESDSLILIQSNNPDRIDQTNVDGIFLYNPVDLNLANNYKTGVEATRLTGDIYIPSVAPGFNKNRLSRKKFHPHLSRKKGETYDTFWKAALASGAEFVSVISFNEWHEGTQIEPAIKGPAHRLPYLSYHGTFRKTGVQAQNSYLRRTLFWTGKFKSQP